MSIVTLTNLRHSMSAKKGIFIVFEGIDGSGTSTQSKLLAKFLCSRFHNPIILTNEPSDSEIGQLIRSLLLKKDDDPTHNNSPLFNKQMTLLMAADRCHHVKSVILPALKQGRIVICTRYVFSSIAYQGIDSQSIDLVNFINQGFPDPDVLFYLDLDPFKAIERIESRGREKDIYETIDRLTQIRYNYLNALSKYGNNWIKIDASQSIDEVKKAVVNHLDLLGMSDLDIC